jgi:hypothetical protein
VNLPPTYGKFRSENDEIETSRKFVAPSATNKPTDGISIDGIDRQEISA